MWSNTAKLIAHVSHMCIDKFTLLTVLQECTITSQLAIFLFWGQKAIQPRVFMKTCFLCVTRTVCHERLCIAGLRNFHKDIVMFFFSPNAITCPLWTSWSSLLGMAGV